MSKKETKGGVRREKRIIRVQARLTPGEQEKVEKAMEQGETMSNCIRRKLLQMPVDSVTQRDFAILENDLRYEMRKIGNNINQYAKVANASGKVVDTAGMLMQQKEIMECVEKCTALLRKMQKEGE